MFFLNDFMSLLTPSKLENKCHIKEKYMCIFRVICLYNNYKNCMNALKIRLEGKSYIRTEI